MIGALFGDPNSAIYAAGRSFVDRAYVGKIQASYRLPLAWWGVEVASVAQFERELIGERTRDKMSAARKKGKWVGGCPVLGYDVDPGGGRLVVNEAEAERVRAIFALFAETGSAQQTLAEIERRGWRLLKSWMRKTGELRSGGRFTLSALRRLLSNILYTGAVRHQEHIYPGEQAAILARDEWERVQSLIPQPALVCGRLRSQHQALLNGLLHCECCAAPMVYCMRPRETASTPTTCAGTRSGRAGCVPSKSLPAQAIEASVLGRIRQAQGVADAAPWEEMDRDSVNRKVNLK